MPSSLPSWSIPPPTPTTRAPTLNAIRRPQPEPTPEAAERTARNLDYCQELIELGMKLARAAADRALDDIAAPPPLAAIPGSSAGAIAQAQDLARRRAPNHGKLFAHLSRAVRQTILLQTYIAEGHAPAPFAPATSQPAVARTSCKTPNPDHDALRRDTLDRLDCALPTGPDGEVAVEHLLRTITEKFGLFGDQPDRPATPPAAQTPNAAPTAHPHPTDGAPKLRKSAPQTRKIAPSEPDRRW